MIVASQFIAWCPRKRGTVPQGTVRLGPMCVLRSSSPSGTKSDSPLPALIQLVDPINQVVVVNRSPHDLIQLEQPLIFRSVIERDPRLSGVMTKHDFVPMNGLDL